MKVQAGIWIALLGLTALAVGSQVLGQGPGPVCVPPPSGMVSWWPGDGNANDIVDGNNGTLQGGATFAPGEVGQAFSFNGVNDFVRVADAPNLRPANITVDAWIFTESVSHQLINYFLSKGTHAGFTGGPGGWSIGLGGSLEIPDCPGTGDAGKLFVFNGLGPANGAGNIVCYGTPLPLNTWTHVAFTNDGSTTKIYVDGQLVAQGAQTFPDNAGVDLSIGRRSDNFWFYKGKVDEVEIYNRALSGSEIQAIFNAGSAGKCKPVCVPPPSGMVSWWPGDGNANDIVDGNNGTLQGGATFAPGLVGQAFSLDGINAFVDVGNAPNLHVSSGDFTVDAWVNFNSLTHPPGANQGAPAGDMSIVDKLSPAGINTDGWRLFKQDDNRFWFCLGGGSFNGCTSGGPLTVQSTTVAVANVWFHVAAVKASNTISMYVNGSLNATKPLGASFTDTNSANLRIGSNAAEGAHLNGLVDEVEIFNRALSAAEILSIFNAGSAGKCKNLPPPGPQPTTLSFTAASATTSDFDDPATVQARLTKTSDGAPVPGEMITFTLGSGSGALTCSATTDATGTATCSLTPNQPAGTFTLTATFAGDTSFGGSSASTTFTVTKEETTLKFTATSPTLLANGQPATFSATLKEDGITPISGRIVRITLGSGAGAQSCTGTTNSSGTASCSIVVNQQLGPNTVAVNFSNDAFFRSSSDTEAVLVFAFLGGGAGGSFVIGDLNATVLNAVTFWGAQWAKVNSLSGGPAPAAFKGFAGMTSTTPPTCGGTWATDLSSSMPPASVPPFMAVIASSSITKSGPTISGNVPKIVIVQTNPGYGPSPDQTGTGTVVAVLCGS